MPSTGSVIRALAMLAVSLAQVGAGRVAALLRHYAATQPGHAAPEGTVARRRGNELDGRGLERGKGLVNVQRLEHHAFGAVGSFVPIEMEADRPARLHHDGVGVVSPLHHDSHFLHPAAVRLGYLAAAAR